MTIIPLSKTDVKTVAGRIKDHNQDNLSVAWSFAPNLLHNKNLSIFDGVTEALNYSDWRTLRIDPTGEVFSTYTFGDMRFLDAPTIVPIPITLGKDQLVEIRSNRASVIVAEKDDDRLAYEAKRMKLNIISLKGQHGQMLEYWERALFLYNDPDDPDAPRKIMLRWGEEVREKFSIPVGVPSREARVYCDRLERERKQLERQQKRDEEQAMMRRREEYQKRLQVLAEQNARKQIQIRAREILDWINDLSKLPASVAREQFVEVKRRTKLYAEAIGADLSSAGRESVQTGV